MRVLVVQDYGSLAGGGEVQTGVLLEGLRERGVEARLFASRAHVEGESGRPDYACHGTTGHLRTVVQTANLSAVVSLQRALRDFRPDVVHVRIFLTQLGPLVLPLLASIPTVYHAVWYRAVCPKGTKLLPRGEPCRQRQGRACLSNHCLGVVEWVPLMLQRRLFERWRGAFDLLVANSAAVRDRLVADGIAPVEVIWNGVPERDRRPPLADPPLVAYAGRLVWEKGVDVLLRAFERARRRGPAARLLVAGEGPELPRLERLTAELGIGDSVEFCGHLPRAALERRLERAWIQVVPGRWEEPFGLAAAEAMMRGTTVVASRAGGPAEIVTDDETGLLVPPGDAASLSDALGALMTDRSRVERLSRAGHAFARERLGARRFVDDWLEVYRRLVGAGT